MQRIFDMSPENRKLQVARLEDQLIRMRWTRVRAELEDPGQYIAFSRYWSATWHYKRAIETYMQLWHWLGNPSSDSWEPGIRLSLLRFPTLLSFVKAKELDEVMKKRSELALI
jgi:hypothetical protein